MASSLASSRGGGWHRTAAQSGTQSAKGEPTVQAPYVTPAHRLEPQFPHLLSGPCSPRCTSSEEPRRVGISADRKVPDKSRLAVTERGFLSPSPPGCPG